MHPDAGNSSPTEVLGTLRFNEFEGGFWSIEPEDGRGTFVLQGWTPDHGFVDGTRVVARVRLREEQFGFLMAGTYADLVEIAPA